MSRYTLTRVSDSVWDIKTGGKKAGFVRKVPAGYAARIGQHCEVRPTLEAAFSDTVAKAFGFKSAAELHAHNRATAQHNAAVRAASKRRAAYVVDELMNGNLDPMLDMITNCNTKA